MLNEIEKQLVMNYQKLISRDSHLSEHFILCVGKSDTYTDTVLKSLVMEGVKVKYCPDMVEINEHQLTEHETVLLIDLDANSDFPLELLLEWSEKFNFPIIALSDSKDLSLQVSALKMGITHFLTKPLNADDLIQHLLLSANDYQFTPLRAYILTEKPEQLSSVSELVRSTGIELLVSNSPMTVLGDLESFLPDVIIMDADFSNCTGIELVTIIRQHTSFQYTPIIFQHMDLNVGIKADAMNLGVVDFIDNASYQELMLLLRYRAKCGRKLAINTKKLEAMESQRKREHHVLNQHALVSVSDVHGNITYVNDLFCKTSGYTRKELLGRNHRVVRSDYHDANFFKEMWKTIANGKTWQGEICNKSKSGERYWVESTISPMLGADGKPYQYVSIRTDITHTKQLAEDLQTRNAAIEHASSGMAIINIDDDSYPITYANDAFITITGFDKEDVTGSSSNFFTVSDISPVEAAHLKMVIQEGQSAKVLVQHTRKDSSTYWTETRIAPVKDKSGTLRNYVAIMDDVSDRIDTAKALMNSEERLRISQNYANIGTWDWNIPTGELVWSERVPPLLGHESGVLEQSYGSFLMAVHPDDREMVVDAVNMALENDAPYDIEHRVIWPDGTERWLLEQGAVSRNENGEPVRMLGVVQDIDTRKRAELALAEREHMLQDAQHLAMLGNWEANLKTGEVYWSDEVYNIYGVDKDNFIPSVEAFFASIHPDDREMVELSSEKLQTTLNEEVEHRIVRPDGSIRYVHERANLELDQEGLPNRLVGTVQDITDRMVALNALRETQEQFAFAVEGAGDGVWDMNVLTGSLLYSGNYEAMLGYKKGELEQTTDIWKSMVHAKDLPRVLEVLDQYLNGELQKYSIELRLRCKSGDYKWILCRGNIIERDKVGKPVRMVGIHSDISEQKRAEDMLSLFRRIFEISTQGIGIADTHGKVIYTNTAYDELHGKSSEQLKGHYLTEFVSDNVGDRLVDKIQSHLSKGESWSGQLPIIGKQDKELMTLSSFGVVKARDNSPQYFFNIMSDFTTELARQKQLAVAKEDAERANHAKSEFLSSMSHELRTPMNVILGFTQLLEYESDLNDEQQDCVHEIRKASNHLLSLINEVLDLAKIESGHIDISMEPVEVCPLIRECLTAIMMMAEARNIKTSHTGMPGVKVRADRTRLKQVLLNLLSNAVKYNRPEGRLHVEISILEEKSMLAISVSDTGMGMSEESLKDLFKPFNRLEMENTKIEGTGIGLTITERLVKMMGGTISVESATGIGSTFTVEMPIEDTIDVKTIEPIQHDINDFKKSYKDEGQYAILYIEDNPANLKLVEQLLSKKTYISLNTAHSPELGIEFATSDTPNLIILDINMPEMDGFQVLKVLKSIESLKNIPILALSANAMPQDIERGKEAGFDDYITKPINISVFYEKLDKYLTIGHERK